MADWEELSLDSFRAAQELRIGGRLRSSVSRAYYAAYCAATNALSEKGLSFPRGRNSPPHENVGEMMKNNLGGYSTGDRKRLARVFRILLDARIKADYMPGQSVDFSLTRDCLRRAGSLLQTLGIEERRK